MLMGQVWGCTPVFSPELTQRWEVPLRMMSQFVDRTAPLPIDQLWAWEEQAMTACCKKLALDLSLLKPRGYIVNKNTPCTVEDLVLFQLYAWVMVDSFWDHMPMTEAIEALKTQLAQAPSNLAHEQLKETWDAYNASRLTFYHHANRLINCLLDSAKPDSQAGRLLEKGREIDNYYAKVCGGVGLPDDVEKYQHCTHRFLIYTFLDSFIARIQDYVNDQTWMERTLSKDNINTTDVQTLIGSEGFLQFLFLFASEFQITDKIKMGLNHEKWLEMLGKKEYVSALQQHITALINGDKFNCHCVFTTDKEGAPQRLQVISNGTSIKCSLSELHSSILLWPVKGLLLKPRPITYDPSWLIFSASIAHTCPVNDWGKRLTGTQLYQFQIERSLETVKAMSEKVQNKKNSKQIIQGLSRLHEQELWQFFCLSNPGERFACSCVLNAVVNMCRAIMGQAADLKELIVDPGAKEKQKERAEEKKAKQEAARLKKQAQQEAQRLAEEEAVKAAEETKRNREAERVIEAERRAQEQELQRQQRAEEKLKNQAKSAQEQKEADERREARRLEAEERHRKEVEDKQNREAEKKRAAEKREQEAEVARLEKIARKEKNRLIAEAAERDRLLVKAQAALEVETQQRKLSLISNEIQKLGLGFSEKRVQKLAQLMWWCMGDRSMDGVIPSKEGTQENHATLLGSRFRGNDKTVQPIPKTSTEIVGEYSHQMLAFLQTVVRKIIGKHVMYLPFGSHARDSLTLNSDYEGFLLVKDPRAEEPEVTEDTKNRFRFLNTFLFGGEYCGLLRDKEGAFPHVEGQNLSPIFTCRMLNDLLWYMSQKQCDWKAPLFKYMERWNPYYSCLATEPVCSQTRNLRRLLGNMVRMLVSPQHAHLFHPQLLSEKLGPIIHDKIQLWQNYNPTQVDKLPWRTMHLVTEIIEMYARYTPDDTVVEDFLQQLNDLKPRSMEMLNFVRLYPQDSRSDTLMTTWKEEVGAELEALWDKFYFHVTAKEKIRLVEIVQAQHAFTVSQIEALDRHIVQFQHMCEDPSSSRQEVYDHFQTHCQFRDHLVGTASYLDTFTFDRDLPALQEGATFAQSLNRSIADL